MTKAFVADASVAVAWCTPAQASTVTDQLLDNVMAGSRITVPPLWPYEVANALLALLRRRRIHSDDYEEARTLLGRLRAELDHEGPRIAATRIADLAMEHKLTVYDAAYLELAGRKQLPLASRDESLNRAAKRLGIPVLL